MGWLRGRGVWGQGRVKDFTETRAFIFNSELWNTDHRTFCKSCQGQSRSTARCGHERAGHVPLVFLNCSCTAFWTMSEAALEDIPVGEGDELWRKFSHWSMSLGVFLVLFFFFGGGVLFGTPRSLQLQGFWCQHEVDHTSQPPSWCILFGFVTSYIMQNYFCTNCLKVIYARFECIPVFLLFYDCQLSWFP